MKAALALLVDSFRPIKAFPIGALIPNLSISAVENLRIL